MLRLERRSVAGSWRCRRMGPWRGRSSDDRPHHGHGTGGAKRSSRRRQRGSGGDHVVDEDDRGGRRPGRLERRVGPPLQRAAPRLGCRCRSPQQRTAAKAPSASGRPSQQLRLVVATPPPSGRARGRPRDHRALRQRSALDHLVGEPAHQVSALPVLEGGDERPGARIVERRRAGIEVQWRCKGRGGGQPSRARRADGPRTHPTDPARPTQQHAANVATASDSQGQPDRPAGRLHG